MWLFLLSQRLHIGIESSITKRYFVVLKLLQKHVCLLSWRQSTFPVEIDHWHQEVLHCDSFCKDASYSPFEGQNQVPLLNFWRSRFHTIVEDMIWWWEMKIANMTRLKTTLYSYSYRRWVFWNSVNSQYEVMTVLDSYHSFAALLRMCFQGVSLQELFSTE